ncbi:MAG: hypothetical protein MJZ68_06235, partial [archaeon]|nr:hypothetical protein [archaeon]
PLAFDFLTRASLSGSTEAQLLLGKSYETGRGRNHNDEEATKYYAMAAAAGNLVGYYELSRFMDHPEIFVRSTQKVVR